MQIIPGQTGSDLLPSQMHLHRLCQAEAFIWRIFAGEKCVLVVNSQCLEHFLWGFDAVSVSHSEAKTSEWSEGSTIS